MVDDSSRSNSVPPGSAPSNPPGRRASLRPDAIAPALEAPLADEELILESLVSALVHGETLEEQWENLHSAAARDDKIAELAFAYEKLTAGTRFRVLSAGNRVAIHLHAADFLLGVFGDSAGAIQQAENALEILPSDETAFERLRGLFLGGGDAIRLSNLYLRRVPHLPDVEARAALVRTAIEQVEALPAREDASLPLLEELTRLDPADAHVQKELGQRYIAEGRTQDAVKLFEAQLAASPGSERALELQRWLIRAYVEELGTPHKAIGYLEELLEADPSDSYALSAAEQLLEQRTVAGRAAAILSRSYQRLGQIQDAASMLTLELRLAAGTRRADVQRELAVLKQDHLDDPKGARELLEPLVSRDPSDDDLRERYVALSAMLDRRVDAARLLSRSAHSAKEPDAKARVLAQVGRLFLQCGDERRGIASFQAAIETGADDPAVLRAAQELCELYARVGDPKRLAKALEQVVLRETELAPRHAAAERLARLCDETGDKKLAVAAWSALLDSSQVEVALERLEGLSSELKDDVGLARVLERRAELEQDAEAARELIIRAATLRSERLADRGAAIRTWSLAAERYGVGLEAFQKLVPLIEAERDFAALARAHKQRAALEQPPEQLKTLARAGQVLVEKLDQVEQAIECYAGALEVDPSFAPALSALERMLAPGAPVPAAERAAEVLSAAANSSGDRRLAVVVLQWRASSMTEAAMQLSLLQQAADLLEAEPRDGAQLMQVAGRALAIAVESAPDQVATWLPRLSEEEDPTRAAEILSEALGARTIDSEPVFAIARALGEALAALGETGKAIEVLRRAHAFDAASPGLVGRIEELLSEGGTPEERLVFYREALARPGNPERHKKLLHSMARLLKRDLGDAAEAIAVWQQILQQDAADQLAHTSLVSAFREQGRTQEAYAELLRMLPELDGTRRHEALASLAELAAEGGDAVRALSHYAELLDAGALSGVWLANAERLAMGASDWPYLVRVLERKLEVSEEPSLGLIVLDRLAQVAAERLGDVARAAEAWSRAATIAASELGDTRMACDLLERVLRVAPGDVAAAERLLVLHAEHADWAEVPRVFAVVLGASSPAVATQRVQELQRLSEQGAPEQPTHDRGPLVIADLALNVRKAHAGAAEVPTLLALEVACLAGREDQAERSAQCFRELIELGDEGGEAARRFEAFLEAQSSPRGQDWRWLFERRAASHDDQVPVWLEWARVEEHRLGDPERAQALLDRVLAQEPDHEQALSDAARLRLAAGDAKAALGLLKRLRDRAQGEPRILADLAYARALIEGTGQVEEGLEVLHTVLTTHPTQPEALKLVQRVLLRPEARAKAAELLDRISQELEDRETGQEILETLLAASRDTPELAERRREWFLQVVEYKEADQPEAALELCLQGALESAQDEGLWDAAERLARRVELPEPVRDAYTAALKATDDAELAELLGRRLIDFYEEWFDEPDRVIELLERVLDIAPTAAWALDRLKLAFNAAGRWTDLFRVYDRAIERSEEDFERESLLEEAALAAKDFAGDAVRAIGYLEQLLTLRPGDSRVENNLERLYEREGQSRPLIELLATRLPKLKGAPLAEMKLRIAALWLDLGDARRSFELIDESLNDAPGGDEPYQLLERLLDLPVPPESLPPTGDGSRRRRALSVRDDVAARLKDYYEELGRTGDVVRMLEVELEAAPGKAELVQRLSELVGIRLERLDDPAGAMRHLSELVGLVPEDRGFREQLSQLAIRTENGVEHAELLVQISERSDSPLSDDLAFEAACVFEREGLSERATALHHQVGHHDEAPEALQLSACQRLDALLASGDQAERRADLLERIALLCAVVPGAQAERQRVLAVAAELADHELQDLERAIRLWSEVLQEIREVEDTDKPQTSGYAAATDGLVDALRRAGKHRELVRALDMRAESKLKAGASAEARADHVWAARVLVDNLEETAEATARWGAIEADFGADAESFSELAALLEREGHHAELAARLRLQAERAEDPRERRLLLVRLAELFSTRTGQIQEALGAYAEANEWEGATQAVRNIADADAALDACKTLHSLAVRYWSEQADSGAAEVCAWTVTELKNRLLERGKHAEVVELLLSAAELDFESAQRRSMRREAALLCHESLSDVKRAVDILRALLDEQPADEIAQASVPRLALLLDQLGDGDAKVALWEQQAECREQASDRGGAAALWSRAAGLAETELEDLDRAKAGYRRGAALGGEDSLEALARLHEAAGDLQGAAHVLEWLCASSSREALAERVLRLANGYEALGRRDLARARLEATLGRAIEASTVRKKLSELYRADQAWVQLAELLSEEAKRATLKRKRRKLFEEAAQLFTSRVGAPERAIPLLEAALEAEPDDVELRLGLVDALCDVRPASAASAGAVSEPSAGGLLPGQRRAEELLRDQLERYGARRPKSRALVHHRLSRVLQLSEGSESALRELEVAAKIDPAQPEILEDLGRVAFELGRGERAERAFRALLLVLKPGAEPDHKAPSRAEAFVYLGEIAVAKDDPIRATEFIESAFEAALESDYESKRLERALRQRGRYELLARVVETRLERATSPAETARALADLVLLYAEDGVGGDTQRGERVRSRADGVLESLDQVPAQSDPLAWSALGQVYEWLGDRDRETQVLERRVAAQGVENADAEALYRLAELRLNAEDTTESGIDLLERALELGPDVPRADAMLRGLLGRQAGLEEAARLLESISRSAGREESLLHALRYLSSLPALRADVIREAVELAQRLQFTDQALAILEEAVARDEAPLEGTDAAWVRIELARTLETQGEVERALELREQASLSLDPVEARDLCLEIAARAKELGQPDRAARVLERVRQDNPADREAWEPLMALCREQGDSERLADLIESTIAVVDDPTARAHLALERAKILLSRGDTSDAIEMLQQIVERYPEETEASVTLAEVLEREGRRDELVELLVTDLERAKDSQEVGRITAVSVRLGALLEALEREDDALDVYQALLDWAPDATEALRRTVAILETRDDAFLLAESIERLLPLEDQDAASALGRRLIELRRSQGDEEAEERALRMLFDADPRDAELGERLSALFEQREDYAAQAAILARCFEAEPTQAELLGRLISAHQKAGELGRALEALSVALTLNPNRPELLKQRAELLETLDRPVDALDDHERIYAQDRNHGEALCEALVRALDVADGDARRGLQKRLVVVYEERGRFDAALEILQGCLAEAPEDTDTLWRLARLARRDHQLEDASGYYQRLALLEEGDRLITAIAELLEICNETGQLADARPGLERAVELFPGDEEISQRLRELYAALGAKRELAYLYLNDAREASNVEARYAALLQAGQLLSTPGGNLSEAIGVLEQARSLVPDELEGIAALGRAYSSAGRAADARVLLTEGVASQRGRRSRALSQIYRELAQIDLGSGSLSSALESLNRAFEMDPKNGALAMELGELALDLDDEPMANRAFRAVTMMRPVTEGEDDGATPQARAQAYYHMGRLAHRRDDLRKAKIFLAKCLNEDPNNQAARQLMEQIG